MGFWGLLLHFYLETSHGEAVILSLYSSHLTLLICFKFLVYVVISCLVPERKDLGNAWPVKQSWRWETYKYI